MLFYFYSLINLYKKIVNGENKKFNQAKAILILNLIALLIRFVWNLLIAIFPTMFFTSGGAKVKSNQVETMLLLVRIPQLLWAMCCLILISVYHNIRRNFETSRVVRTSYSSFPNQNLIQTTDIQHSCWRGCTVNQLTYSSLTFLVLLQLLEMSTFL